MMRCNDDGVDDDLMSQRSHLDAHDGGMMMMLDDDDVDDDMVLHECWHDV